MAQGASMKIVFFNEKEKAEWEAEPETEKKAWMEFAKKLKYMYPDAFKGDEVYFYDLKTASANGF